MISLYNRQLCLILLSLIFSNQVIVHAQEIGPIQTDRPDLTESAYNVPSGFFQFESGFMRIYASSSAQLNVHPTLLFKYGLSPAFELRLITDLVTSVNNEVKETMFLPVAIGVKIAVSEEKGLIPKTAFIGHLRVPFGGNSDFPNTYIVPSFRFTMQHNLSDRLSLGYNLGAEWTGYSASPKFIYTLTSAISLTSSIGAFIELYGLAAQSEKAEHSIDGGFTYLIDNNCLIDISVGLGLTSNAPEYFISAGFSFRIDTRKRKS